MSTVLFTKHETNKAVYSPSCLKQISHLIGWERELGGALGNNNVLSVQATPSLTTPLLPPSLGQWLSVVVLVRRGMRDGGVSSGRGVGLQVPPGGSGKGQRCGVWWGWWWVGWA